MKYKKISIGFFFYFTFLYLEIAFKILTHQIFSIHTFVFPLCYTLLLSCLFTILSSFGKEKINKIIAFLLLLFLTVWTCAEVIFKNSFHVYFSIATIFFADQAISFFDKILEILWNNILPIIILWIPFLFIILLQKRISFAPIKVKNKIALLLLGVISYLCFYAFLLDQNTLYASSYELYYSMDNNALNKETFGMFSGTLIEMRNLLFPKEKVLYEVPVEEKEEPVVYEPNILDIPFDTLMETEEDETVKSMHEYFKKDLGTLQNEYTNFFSGKNLILFMAESFNDIAVSEELTPTLYKFTHEGFQFKNFYSPVILSTIGGEFQELTGLYPNLSMLSNVWRGGKNAFPFGLGKVFQEKGYMVKAYHNHKYYFQNRDVYLKSLGFDEYLGCQNGLEKRINCQNWPESDLEMIQETTSDYLSSERPFFTYYVTVSGHMSYNFTNNSMAIKNKEMVENLPYSTDIKAYLASQIELDKALAKLIQDLEEQGKLEDTVIALVGDHYPYDISLDHIKEIAPSKDETMEINRSYFILWNAKMDSVKVSKVGGNMDVLPTIYNLFGIPYDSRLFMGKDLLSSQEGLVIFADQSWRSDKGRYYASTKEFVPSSDIIPEDYVTKTNQLVSNQVNLSKLILEKNYYKKVLGE